ncbi:MAG: hypothetical protein IT210_12410 [Armatimonadetes bacterium]|nr:hypothetical protein [Armatimonadota bacterium]
MSDLLYGVSAYPDADAGLMKEAGIEWVRLDFPFPFKEKAGGEPSEDYLRAREEARRQQEKGLKVMGVTPLHGIGIFRPDADGVMRMQWESFAPDWMGQPGTPRFNESYRKTCAFMGGDLRGTVRMWQVSNEQDIVQFAGPLSPRQACGFILSGAQGLKESDPFLTVGTNTAGSPLAYYLYGRLFAGPLRILDYCGVDGYYGTWAPGGPNAWGPRIAELFEMVQVKILVNEWGYASAGGLMTAEESASGAHVCQHKKWRYAWGEGHTPQGQGDFVREAFRSFLPHRDKLLGVFFYRWEDQESCWQCGAPDCPAETAWGLVDLQSRPKPSYHAFKKGVALLG